MSAAPRNASRARDFPFPVGMIYMSTYSLITAVLLPLVVAVGVAAWVAAGVRDGIRDLRSR